MLISAVCAVAQNADSLALAQDSALKAQPVVPPIEYTLQRRTYEIAGITVSGADNYEDFVLIGFSGLAVGDRIEVPGEQITKSIRRFWKQGLFSDVKILAPPRSKVTKYGSTSTLSNALVYPN